MDTNSDNTIQAWAFPAELEPWRHLIMGTSLDIEELMTRYAYEAKLAVTNVYVYEMAVSVSSQISMLRRLLDAGLLVQPQE